MQGLILAAGMGKRLKDLTRDDTKCMVKVNGVRLIDRLLSQLAKLGLRRTVLVTGYQGAKLRKHVGRRWDGMRIDYVDNPIYDKTNNIYSDVYTSKVESYTHKKTYDIVVSKEFLHSGDRVLIIDDFLAKGSAINALADLIEAAGAHIVGAGIVIEKSYQSGAELVRRRGIRLESLARIKSMSVEDGVEFMADGEF